MYPSWASPIFLRLRRHCSTVKENDIFPFFTTPSTPLRLSAPQMHIVYHTLSNFLESIFLFKLKRDHKEDENKHFNNNNMGENIFGPIDSKYWKVYFNQFIFWNRFQEKKITYSRFNVKILKVFAQFHLIFLELIWRKKKKSKKR